MKLYKAKTSAIARELADVFINEEAVEVQKENLNEFYLDIEAVLNSYIETGKQIHEEAQNIIKKRNLDFDSFNKIKSELAKKYNFGLGENAMDWLTDQLIEMIMHSQNVEEVWAEDIVIRRLARPILEKQSEIDSEIDSEVRSKIKNLSEGSMSWDIKYKQVLEDVRRKKGL